MTAHDKKTTGVVVNRTALWPAFRTADGGTIVVGRTYFIKKRWSEEVIEVRCVGENRGNRYWWAQYPTGGESRIKISHTSETVFAKLSTLRSRAISECRRNLSRARLSARRSKRDDARSIRLAEKALKAALRSTPKATNP